VFIEIESLKPEPLYVRHVYEIGELKFDHNDASLGAPVCIRFTLTHKEKDLHVEGTVETKIRHLCARCLRECTFPLSAGFDLLYLPQPVSTGVDEEIELKDEDLAVGFYDGLQLDVDLMILEQIELSMPMKFLCGEDCKGLCASCGANLNDGACACKTEATDPRLAVLLEFRKKMEK
jgi:uncharacterized protein